MLSSCPTGIHVSAREKADPHVDLAQKVESRAAEVLRNGQVERWLKKPSADRSKDYCAAKKKVRAAFKDVAQGRWNEMDSRYRLFLQTTQTLGFARLVASMDKPSISTSHAAAKANQKLHAEIVSDRLALLFGLNSELTDVRS